MATKKAAKKSDKKQPRVAKEEGITFKCHFCGETRPITEMRILTRFFPQIVACRDCERKMQ
jgi:hypothetical protein